MENNNFDNTGREKKKLKERVTDTRRFLEDDIWRVTDNEQKTPFHQFGFDILKKLELTVQRFALDRMMNKASALTYSTLLSVVPILAIVFAIAKGFGVSSVIEHEIRSNFSGQQAVVDTLLNFTNSYLEHTKSGVFIGVGLVLLLWTLIMLTGNIERTFNQIWQVKKPRDVFRTITDYTAIFFLLPILIVVSSGLSIFMTTMLKEMPDFLLLNSFLRFLVKLVPFALTCLMFTGLYVFMPNTMVRFRAALVPGLLAGIAFQFVQYFYINSQIWVSSYNAIYGSFAAIPLFMLWIQISWCICLFGAELSYANQNIEIYNFSKDTQNISRRYHDFLCVLIMSLICRRFADGGKPYTAGDLAKEHHIPLRLVNNLLYELTLAGMLAEVTHDEKGMLPHYLPSRDISSLSVGDLLDSLDTRGSENFKIQLDSSSPHPWKTLEDARAAYLAQTRNILLKDL
jgi:membrane protein